MKGFHGIIYIFFISENVRLHFTQQVFIKRNSMKEEKENGSTKSGRTIFFNP